MIWCFPAIGPLASCRDSASIAHHIGVPHVLIAQRRPGRKRLLFMVLEQDRRSERRGNGGPHVGMSIGAGEVQDVQRGCVQESVARCKVIAEVAPRSALFMPCLVTKLCQILQILRPEAVPSATERAGSCTFHFKRVPLPRLPRFRPGTAIPAPGLPQRHFAWAVCCGSLLSFDIRILGPPPRILGTAFEFLKRLQKRSTPA